MNSFNLYFAGPYAAAGFKLEHECGVGITQSINFLETTAHVHGNPDQDAWTTHYIEPLYVT